jgi:hypothetical protein
MKHLKTLTEWTSWRDDLYEPGETWLDRVAQMREEQKRLEIQSKRKKKQRKAIPPKYKSKVITSPSWKEREYAQELELKENASK